MRKRLSVVARHPWGAVTALGLAALLLSWATPYFPAVGYAGLRTGQGAPMPEFTATAPSLWVNSKPLVKADLKGKVVLLEVWTSY